jgi:enoyl-CoA hydratase/carnithine racemase
MQPTASDEVLIRREGRAGRITMNRPKALNALTYPMVGRIWHALLEWRDDPQVEFVLIDGAGDRGLCAGGDVRWLYDARTQGSGQARAFWREEYRLNALIGRYPKPYVAAMDGIVMGGGIGLSAHGDHRIVTERSRLAMPETGIGLVPDVGGTWLLSHAPDKRRMSRETGTYLALTGRQFNGAEALDLGFANTLIMSAQLPDTLSEMVADGRPDGVMIRNNSVIGEAPQSSLNALASSIDAAFAFDRVEAIMAALEGMPGEWAAETLAVLRTKSPLALKLTLAALRRARGYPSLEECLNMEYRLTVRLYEHGEFLEGVRALIVDKDKTPRWNPVALEGVTAAMVETFFVPLAPDEELGLKAEAPSRTWTYE